LIQKLSVAMSLDPLSALSVASAVVQFIDFAKVLIEKGYEFYNSADGALAEHNELRLIAGKLDTLTQGLDRSWKSFDVDSPLLREEEGLKLVVRDCRKAARELSKALEELQLTNDRGLWKSFRQALKTIWSKEDIDSKMRTLQMAQDQMALHLLVVVGYGLPYPIRIVTDALDFPVDTQNEPSPR
jgi:N-terminal domain on NACHT_NTPase and P-loop NTPases